MDLLELLFGAGPGIIKIMDLGYMPKDEDFLELTSEQYRQLYEKKGYTKEKVFALLPKDPKHYVEAEFNELTICRESDIEMLKDGWEIIEDYCQKSGLTFTTDRQKIAYAASLLPDVFSKGTPFEQCSKSNMKIASLNPDATPKTDSPVKLHTVTDKDEKKE